ncbi:hypothetical protein AeMF1_007973 [Aphanomyces euteiches]|nr:hypothetical protein AeMF1_007973 [Aphanomyces euteiches]
MRPRKTAQTLPTRRNRRPLSDQLPVYMVPAVWIGLDVMPMNSNGKIDKKALEQYDFEMETDDLVTENEHKLAKVWSEVLGIPLTSIRRQTSFFALGGDSISAIRVASKAKSEDLHLTSALVMKNAILSRMASKAQNIQRDDRANTYESVSGAVPLTPIQHVSFAHPWKNPHYWNLSMGHRIRTQINASDLQDAVKQLVTHHDMLRARFSFSPECGWSQYITEASTAGPANVSFEKIDSFDALEAAILEKERSLNLVDGPVYAVTVFETPDKTQYLQFTLHHAIVDLVSWRITDVAEEATIDCKDHVLQRRIGSNTWAMISSLPPNDRSNERLLSHSVTLDADVARKLDSANAVYETNIQELVLAGLTGAFAQLRNDLDIEGTPLHLTMEGHGRDAWDPTLDISSTVGWLTCEYPVVFSATKSLPDLLLQVKQKLRAVPNKGLSYGAIKHLLAPSEAASQIQSHRTHNIAFNYAGRFQEQGSSQSLFDVIHGLNVPQSEQGELMLCPASFGVAHVNDSLVLEMAVPDWLMSEEQMLQVGHLWCTWMKALVNHCLDANTIGGRTLSDVPLLRSVDVVKAVESEMMSTLDLRPIDVEDIYPVTPLQAGILSIMMQDPSEYVLQNIFDIHGDFDFSRLQQAWMALSLDLAFLRTVFVSTAHGLFQALARNDFSQWNMLDETWQSEDIESQTK